jgi:glycosyltransferase involved in cell wall biosynthesis
VAIASWLVEMSTALSGNSATATLVPNAIDPSIFFEDIEISRGDNLVAMMWHPAEWKGSLDGLEALRRAKDTYSGLEVVLFSTFDRPKGLPTWMRFVQNPSQVDLREIYRTAAVYLSPSHTEGWPLPPAEAMACGCALISTNIPGVADYARNGETAMLTPVGDIDAMAAAISTLLSDKDLRQRLAAAGNFEIHTKFNWTNSVDALERVLTEVAVEA